MIFIHIHSQLREKKERDLQDGRGVKCGDHLPPNKYIKIHLHVEQLSQNTYWTLAEDLRLPKRQENPHVPGCVADRVLVLWPGVRPEILRWESRVQDTGTPETSWPHITSIGNSSPRDLHLNAKTQLPHNGQQVPVLDAPCQTTSKTGTQPHPLAQRLPKIILSSQTPQNTPLDTVLPTRKTRSSLTHQNTGTSPLHQEAYTSHWTNLTHLGQIPNTTGTTNLQPAKRRPQIQ